MKQEKILVAVTGMSPQIVTETLYALAFEKSWIPKKIFVLTTTTGKQKLCESLLGEYGFFFRLCQEYSLPNIAFTEENIIVIQDHQGNDLADIRTPEENSLAADQIVKFIHQLCSRPETELHVSIAGGRKSMGFYIGYALSLFGRSQDRMSHVLVEPDFEQSREFYYPSKRDKILNTPSGMRNAAEAKVMLADIPFVRMRENLPEPILGKDWNYLEAVDITQRDLNKLDVIIDVAQHKIICADIAFVLPYQQFAIYAAFAALRQQFPDRSWALDGNPDREDGRIFGEKALEYMKFIRPAYKSQSPEGRERCRRFVQKFERDERLIPEFKSNVQKKLQTKLHNRSALFLTENTGVYGKPAYRLAVQPNAIHFINGDI